LGRIKEPLLLDTPRNIHEKIHTTIIESTYGNRIHAPRQPEINSLIDEIDTAESSVVLAAFSN
jgi:Cft2 family RNA processing exonuclease